MFFGFLPPQAYPCSNSDCDVYSHESRGTVLCLALVSEMDKSTVRATVLLGRVDSEHSELKS